LLNRGELRQIEGRLRTSVVSLNRRNIPDVTMIEVVDEAVVWSQAFGEFDLKNAGVDLEYLFDHTPLLICAIASEIGFAFEGVGTIFWARFDEVIGDAATIAQRQRIAEVFRGQASLYNLSRPTHSAFSEHFSIISWPIANALLPSDLVGPVTRLLARAPVCQSKWARAECSVGVEKATSIPQPRPPGRRSCCCSRLVEERRWQRRPTREQPDARTVVSEGEPPQRLLHGRN
jgi:hypothetical protein